jgi:ATP-dependent DNA helicase PIF1
VSNSTLNTAEIKLTDDQKKVIELLNSTNNAFITGPAGTGKSVGFKYWLRNNRIPVLASTGAAALLLGGRTFHSFFGLGIMQGPVELIIEDAINKKSVRNNLKFCESIAIDEISMIPSEVLSVAEEIARLVRGKDIPWGGLRIIALGDFLQLPPVSKHGSDIDWAFASDVWEISGFKVSLLREVIRTSNFEFASMLNKIRKGVYNREIFDFLLSHQEEVTTDFEGTRLYPHRARVDAVNMEMLAKLPGKVVEIPTTYRGKEQYLKSLKSSMPIPEVLCLKEGALVMVRRNAPDFSYVNGSIGTIVKIADEYLGVHLIGSNSTIQLAKCSFDHLDGSGDIACSARNFPISLAWACTIHKAQGATIDRVSVDLRGIWEGGQAYVALSRVRESENLIIEGWDNDSIRADENVVRYYEELEASN